MNNNRKPYVIIHKDGDWENNNPNNLEWLKAPLCVSEGNCYKDGLRSVNEIIDYMHEAMDKAWLSRSYPSDDADIEETREENISRIRNIYIYIRMSLMINTLIGKMVTGTASWALFDGYLAKRRIFSTPNTVNIERRW